ncbi:MAG: energy-coupling factor transporter ATPase, partial [Alicyclobacillus sp.]|nr:energy-coupling factor transporter ATPase [Alicyclobacillus sp.]
MAAQDFIKVSHVSFTYASRSAPTPSHRNRTGLARGTRPPEAAPASVRKSVESAFVSSPQEVEGAVLTDVSLEIAEGSYVAILGRNGSGKSTLARLLNGLLRPTAGSVVVDGFDTRDAAHLQDIRRTVGMVFQHPDNQMVATMVEEDVAFGLENLCVPRAEMRERVTEALRAVGMEAHRRRPPHQLSGGQKQRVAIAAVMAMRPRCIVFDEATSMLDAEGRQDVLELMDTLHQQGVTIITITHQMEEAVRADRVIVLERGRVVKDGSPRDVFADVASLRALHLDVPIATEVAHRLREEGFVMTSTPLTPEEFAEGLPKGQAQDSGVGSQQMTSARDAIARTDPIIQVRNVSHVYMAGTPLAQPALTDVTLDIYPGEIVAFVGQTGSGKSTLVQHLNGLLMPQVGEVVVDGIRASRNPKDAKRLRGTVGVV